MKKKLIPLILSLGVIIIMMAIIIYQNISPHHQTINITITLYQENKELVSTKQFSLNHDMSLIDLLKKNYDVKMQGTMLTKIDTLDTPNTAQKFIKIYQNCQPIQTSILQLEVHDNDEIVFIIEPTSLNMEGSNEFC